MCLLLAADVAVASDNEMFKWLEGADVDQSEQGSPQAGGWLGLSRFLQREEGALLDEVAAEVEGDCGN